jgi:hypothetical protein
MTMPHPSPKIPCPCLLVFSLVITLNVIGDEEVFGVSRLGGLVGIKATNDDSDAVYHNDFVMLDGVGAWAKSMKTGTPAEETA